jgi:hypothetical protein
MDGSCAARLIVPYLMTQATANNIIYRYPLTLDYVPYPRCALYGTKGVSLSADCGHFSKKCDKMEDRGITVLVPAKERDYSSVLSA